MIRHSSPHNISSEYLHTLFENKISLSFDVHLNFCVNEKICQCVLAGYKRTEMDWGGGGGEDGLGGGCEGT